MCCPVYQMKLTRKRICTMRCVPINRSSHLSESPLSGEYCNNILHIALNTTFLSALQINVLLPRYARLPSYRGAHGNQGINSCRYPFTTPGLRETIVDKMPCLGAQALSGTRTRDPLITSREHEPIHYSSLSTNRYTTVP